MTTAQALRLCREYGIEFQDLPARRWAWRSIGDGSIIFDWIGSFRTIREAADDCIRYCGFED